MVLQCIKTLTRKKDIYECHCHFNTNRTRKIVHIFLDQKFRTMTRHSNKLKE